MADVARFLEALDLRVRPLRLAAAHVQADDRDVDAGIQHHRIGAGVAVDIELRDR